MNESWIQTLGVSLECYTLSFRRQNAPLNREQALSRCRRRLTATLFFVNLSEIRVSVRIVPDVLVHCYSNSSVVLSDVDQCLVACFIHQTNDISVDHRMVIPLQFRD